MAKRRRSPASKRWLKAISQRSAVCSRKAPYRLGGSSFGGVLAFELARLLLEAGERPELVVLIDTPGPGAMPAGFRGDAEILSYLLSHGEQRHAPTEAVAHERRRNAALLPATERRQRAPAARRQHREHSPLSAPVSRQPERCWPTAAPAADRWPAVQKPARPMA